jgi:hypothetical protein
MNLHRLRPTSFLALGLCAGISAAQAGVIRLNATINAAQDGNAQ